MIDLFLEYKTEYAKLLGPLNFLVFVAFLELNIKIIFGKLPLRYGVFFICLSKIVLN